MVMVLIPACHELLTVVLMCQTMSRFVTCLVLDQQQLTVGLL